MKLLRTLARICEYLSCDGTEVTPVDRTPPLKIEDNPVAQALLPRIARWRRLERDGVLVEEGPPAVG